MNRHHMRGGVRLHASMYARNKLCINCFSNARLGCSIFKIGLSFFKIADFFRRFFAYVKKK